MSEAFPHKELLVDVNALQRQASAPDQSVWVGAAAGSGKTKVLADRVIRLLLNGVSPNRILCLTFTRAAAAEMSLRLTRILSKWATCSNKELDDALYDLQNYEASLEQRDRARRLFAHVLACPGGMRLLTIHGFAQEVLRRFPLEAGLPPHFTVMDEADATALWHDVLIDILQENAQSEESETAQAFSVLSTMMAEGTLQKLLQEMRSQKDRLDKAIQKAGSLEALMGLSQKALGLEEEDTVDSFHYEMVREGSFNRKQLHHAALCASEKGGKSDQSRATRILTFLECTDDAQRLQLCDEYIRGFLTLDLEPYKKNGIKKLLEDHPEIDEIYKEEAERLQNLLVKINAAQTLFETHALLTFGLKVSDAYDARKRKQAVLDYDDLIAKINALLSQSDMAQWVLYKLDGGIDHMLVDEAQDTNPQQWQIVKTVADEYFSGEGVQTDQDRTLFVVGDEKQSIYSFLKADPEEFERMRCYFSDKIKQAGNSFEEVPLNVSFRSTPAVLKAVDAVFEDQAVRQGVSRDPVHHEAYRAEHAGRVEVWPCVRSPEEVDDEKVNKKEAQDWELPLGYETANNPAADLADKIARQIKQWVQQGLTIFDRDLKEERPITYGDVMVLIQKRQAFVYHLVRALKKHEVEVSGVDRMKLTQQLSVMDLLALLQFTLLPEDDLTLATVLRGPLLNASEDDLMRLAIGRKGSLWSVLLTSQKDEDQKRCAYLRYMAALADQTPPLQMLVRILSEPCPADSLSGRRAISTRLGPDAEDPIDELINVAEAYGQRHTPSLQSFLHWLFSTEVEVKREMEQATGCVRIATVHGSKGLEAPIVILPDTMSVPDRAKLDKILWRTVHGVDLPYYVPRTPLHPDLKEIQDEALVRREEEQRRLLYVAMTRAADRLYVGGYENSKPKKAKEGERSFGKKGAWYSLIANGLLPYHQDEVELDDAAILQPEIVLADYAGLSTMTPKVKTVATEDQVTLPDWAYKPPPEEPTPPRPLIPSRPSEEDRAEEPSPISPQNVRFARGRIIHRLLQNLPDIEEARWEEAAQRYVASPLHDLDDAQQTEIVSEVLSLLRDPQFAPLFSDQSRAEQPLVGMCEGRLIAGQVDRLVLMDEEVWVVDYKTNRPPPTDPAKLPPVYRKQMEAYRAVLQSIYKDKKVRCFLLWTYTALIMEVE